MVQSELLTGSQLRGPKDFAAAEMRAIQGTTNGLEPSGGVPVYRDGMRWMPVPKDE
jgi:hypothetical protein